jgi:hypothetical protein
MLLLRRFCRTFACASYAHFRFKKSKHGGFELALVAQIFGPSIAVVGGGIGTILVVMAVALIWPEMRRLGAISPDG